MLERLIKHQLTVPDSTIYYLPNWCDTTTADRFFERLKHELPWEQGEVKLFGKSHRIPRLQSWHGDPGVRYTYSNVELQAQGWSPALLELREKLLALDLTPNAVLANYYRDGMDSMGWHRDNEKELGARPVIASVSLGAERDFILRHRATQQREVLRLAHGSLLIMAGDTQHYWEHALPKRARVSRPRINLTFRTIRS
ncbi:alpha-ketoglutarate-dependent dioxygenase AlkB [Aliidiomarina halalkaliphila]|uniref:Alpha-ketoglutarate-dependent dioxygenase AlkB n=1 Tax=Aliidiomarina halalkaliphila TaxID=2593535 RepID=A0A552X2M4_9GAMM|nr:alpha-ketoglutarate-dependent dioxygenase AlkB [Aliidiomarina halalkaliphila]TRW49300.1 alpha-ketoglutarate-dependent dioxygenase AlkB [Aliidiomarina halalkaliphila]